MGVLRGFFQEERQARARYKDALADIPTLAWEYSCLRSQASYAQSGDGDLARAVALEREADRYLQGLLIHRDENEGAYQEAMHRSLRGHTKRGSIIYSTLVEVLARRHAEGLGTPSESADGGERGETPDGDSDRG